MVWILALSNNDKELNSIRQTLYMYPMYHQRKSTILSHVVYLSKPYSWCSSTYMHPYSLCRPYLYHSERSTCAHETSWGTRYDGGPGRQLNKWPCWSSSCKEKKRRRLGEGLDLWFRKLYQGLQVGESEFSGPRGDWQQWKCRRKPSQCIGMLHT